MGSVVFPEVTLAICLSETCFDSNLSAHAVSSRMVSHMQVSCNRRPLPRSVVFVTDSRHLIKYRAANFKNHSCLSSRSQSHSRLVLA